MLGLRSEASSRFEKQLHPDLCMRAQRIASRLMVELCGGEAGARARSTSTPGSPPVTELVLRGPGSRGSSGWRSRRPTRSPTWSGSASGSRPTATSLEVTVPPDRHYDVTREVDLIEEVGRVHGLDEHLPATLPAAAGAGRRAEPRAAPAAPGRGRDARPRLRRDRRLELHRPRRGRPPADRGETTRGPTGVVLANPLSEDQSVMRTTLLGSLLDVARAQPRPRRRARRPLRVRPRLPARPADGPKSSEPADRPIDPLAGEFAGERAAPFTSRTGSARSPSGRWSRSPGGAGARRPTSSRSRASSRRSPPSSAPSSRSTAGDRAVPAPGPRGRGRGRRRARPAGSARSTRWSAVSGTSTRRSPSKSTSRR